MRAVLLTALILGLMTELLSLVDGIRPTVVVICWLLVIAVGVRLALRREAEGPRWQVCLRWARERLARGVQLIIRTPSVLLMAIGVLAALGIILTIALASPPNNWDSMSYHLPRVMHWASDHNVRFYPTSIDRQLYSGPMAEYVILHVYLLTGSDLLFNSVQWSALAGVTVLAGLIAQLLGGDRRAQALAAVVAVTTPMAILEGSSTQNDLVEAFFLMLVVHAALTLRAKDRIRPVDVWPLAAALALALLAKSTGYLLAGPFVVLALSRRWRSPRLLIAPLVVLVGFVLAVNLGQAVRNENAYGSLVGPPDSHVLVNSHFSPAVTVVSGLRLFASGATTSHADINKHLLGALDRGSSAVGVKQPDQGTLYGATNFSLGWSMEEDYASYPVQTFAIVLVLLLTVLRVPPLRGLRAGYVLAAACSFLLFASYLRWQPWINRLDMPLALMWSPAVAVVVVAWHRFLALPVALAFGWLAPSFLLHNQTRPLEGASSVLKAPKQGLMFWTRSIDTIPYDAATKLIAQRHAKVIGLVEGADDWEYPLWRLNGGALNGIRFVDIRPSDLGHKPMPHYDLAVCTDPIIVSCNSIAKPGWSIVPLGAGMIAAVPAS